MSDYFSMLVNYFPVGITYKHSQRENEANTRITAYHKGRGSSLTFIVLSCRTWTTLEDINRWRTFVRTTKQTTTTTSNNALYICILNFNVKSASMSVNVAMTNVNLYKGWPCLCRNYMPPRLAIHFQWIKLETYQYALNSCYVYQIHC